MTTNPNCEAARIMHDAIFTASTDGDLRCCDAANQMAAWYGGLEPMLERLKAEAENQESDGMHFIIDRTSTDVLKAATGRTRAEWFGLLVAPELRYVA